MTDPIVPADSAVDFTQEVRFAVVMYGGSSLAIYMNGVAQEMLRLVRATASLPGDETRPYIPDSELSGTERVYRKLGKILNRGRVQEVSDETPISTRFVIDILSGTSAGGINAVFLAKALANDQNITPLKNLWLKQGDIGVLINDKESDRDIKIGVQDPPRSVLSSRRMCYELLDALEGMDAPAPGKGAAAARVRASSPYVDELDLYTTATDIWGRTISIQLADNMAEERRHLNSFHFAYNSSRNDFARDKNPFMTFAARCTSAHPAPFEPMKLSDMNEILDKHPAYKGTPDFRSDDKRWRHFFEEYLQRADDGAGRRPVTAQDRARLQDSLAKKFEDRPFSDGGVLDNSPFSFAINKLPFRHTKLPVDRKLLYIEPVPQHPERELDPSRPPDAFKNAWLSLSVLPSYQTIREDLERVLDRNRLLERVNRILHGVEKDEMARLAGARPADQASFGTFEFGKTTLGEMIRRMGSSWGGYQRLRVAETTDELVKIIASAAGFDEESDEFLSIRYLVRAWRDERYDPYGVRDPLTDHLMESVQPVPEKLSQNWFLFQYDFKWRLRRLKFVLLKADAIASQDERSAEIMRITEQEPGAPAAAVRGPAPGGNKEFRKYMQALKTGLSEAMKILEERRDSLLSRVHADSPHSHPLGDAVAAIPMQAEELLEILKKPTEEEREAAALRLLEKGRAGFESFLKTLNEKLKEAMTEVSARIKGEREFEGKGVLQLEAEPPNPPTPEYLARKTLRYYYDNFDRYDMISYPILYATNIGEETDTVEIFRVSPEDAGFLVEDPALRKHKLAGTSLSNFGAFFDEGFRSNDILWGRLDCADRLITALLSAAPASARVAEIRAELIKEASRAIIAEEMSSEDKAGLRGLIAAQMAGSAPGETGEQFIAEMQRRLTTTGPPDLLKMREFLRTCLTGRDPLKDFVETSRFEHELPPKVMVQTSARATRVFGKMLEGIADDQRWDRKKIRWVTRLTQLFWGLAEVSVPGSIPNLIFRHWLKLLYLFEFLMVFIGVLLVNPTVQQFGLLAFGITSAVHGITLLLGDRMVGKEGKPSALWWWLVKAIFLALLIVTAVLGVFFLVMILGASHEQDSLANGAWRIVNSFRDWVARDEPNGRNLRTALRFSVPAVLLLFFLLSIRKDIRDYLRRKRRSSQ